MKKFLFLTLLALWCSAGARLMAQNCEHIVLTHYGNDQIMVANLPEGKFQWFCAYSHNALQAVDALPQGMQAYSLSVLHHRYTQAVVPANFVVNMDSISLYEYTFEDYQMPEVDVYFATPGSAHPYLKLRSVSETFQLTTQQVDIYSYGDMTHTDAIRNEESHK